MGIGFEILEKFPEGVAVFARERLQKFKGLPTEIESVFLGHRDRQSGVPGRFAGLRQGDPVRGIFVVEPAGEFRKERRVAL